MTIFEFVIRVTGYGETEGEAWMDVVDWMTTKLVDDMTGLVYESAERLPCAEDE
jgi:hypothetical protein